MKIKINSIFGKLLFEGDFSSIKECVSAALKSGVNLSFSNLRGANLSRMDLHGANFSSANLSGVDLSFSDLSSANLRGVDLSFSNLSFSNLRGVDLCGANLSGELKAEKMRVFSGLYKYRVWAVLAQDGTRYVRMGCLFHSLDDWDKIGIRKSNESEFPDDGSEKCEERVAAFEFAKAAAMRLK